jgi:hypothetical protein
LNDSARVVTVSHDRIYHACTPASLLRLRVWALAHAQRYSVFVAGGWREFSRLDGDGVGAFYDYAMAPDCCSGLDFDYTA